MHRCTLLYNAKKRGKNLHRSLRLLLFFVSLQGCSG